MTKSRIALLLAAGLFAAGSAVAIAQVISVPTQATIGTTDLIQVVPGGVPSAGNAYVTPAQISGAPGYTKTVPLTGFNLTFTNSQVWMLLYPAGTLATGTITTAPNPSDGQRECIRSSQTQTALTFTANTGQTIGTALTALTAGTAVCYTFSKSNATWDPA